MKAQELYEKLEKDFITAEMNDKWAEYMKEVDDYLCENFKKRSMGLVCDFAKEIKKVYTAVFPEDEILQKIAESGEKDSMLFVHHPSIWDIRKAPNVFYQMNTNHLNEFKKNRVSIYNLHTPLDNYGKYSTSCTLAEAVGVKPENKFGQYFGAYAGAFGTADYDSVAELKKRLENAVGHKCKLYSYGPDLVKDNKIAFVGGGGNSTDFLKNISDAGVNAFVTGITAKNDHSKEAHEFAEKQGINLIGGTHYSTEKFACQKICEYFKKIGLSSEFIPGKPVMKDM